jgi:hypothetical protein
MCLVCGCSNGGNTSVNNMTNNNFPVVVFSDVHFNPFYDPSLFPALAAADATDWPAIFKSSKITAPSVWSSDTNYPLLMLALASIKQNLGASPLSIYTGDILGHNFLETFDSLNGGHDVAAMEAFADKTVTFFMNQVRSSVGSIPVMFALGNSDSYGGIQPEGTFLRKTAELYYSKFLNSSVDHQTFLDSFQQGGYYSAEPPGTNLMVIGLNTIIFELSGFTAKVDSELDWFEKRLLAAKTTGKKVWLLMHIPPGEQIDATAGQTPANVQITKATMMWQADSQTKFLNLLAKYPGIITHILAAHTHMDEYRIMPHGDLLEITPSITPYFGNNPAYKIYSFANDTYKAIDFSSLNYDLATNPQQFNSYYTFSAAYSVQGFLNDSLAQLYPELATNSTKQALYRGHYFSGHNYSIPVNKTLNPISDTNWRFFWCGTGKVDEQEFIKCVNSF